MSRGPFSVEGRDFLLVVRGIFLYCSMIAGRSVRNLILGYPTLIHKNIGTFLGEIHRVNPEILGYPRIPRHLSKALPEYNVMYTIFKILMYAHHIFF